MFIFSVLLKIMNQLNISDTQPNIQSRLASDIRDLAVHSDISISDLPIRYPDLHRKLESVKIIMSVLHDSEMYNSITASLVNSPAYISYIKGERDFVDGTIGYFLFAGIACKEFNPEKTILPTSGSCVNIHYNMTVNNYTTDSNVLVDQNPENNFDSTYCNENIAIEDVTEDINSVNNISNGTLNNNNFNFVEPTIQNYADSSVIDSSFMTSNKKLTLKKRKENMSGMDSKSVDILLSGIKEITDESKNTQIPFKSTKRKYKSKLVKKDNNSAWKKHIVLWTILIIVAIIILFMFVAMF